jgi:hypothetical protein
LIFIKIKTKTQTHEISDIIKQTTTYFEAYYNDYLIIIEKEAKQYQTKEKTVWSVTCYAPDGSYVCNRYFEGTMKEAIIEVLEEIEFCEEGTIKCQKCNTYMENDDFYYDEEREEYIDIWICPKCGYREDIPE